MFSHMVRQIANNFTDCQAICGIVKFDPERVMIPLVVRAAVAMVKSWLTFFEMLCSFSPPPPSSSSNAMLGANKLSVRCSC